MSKYSIAWMPGDGIGQDVMEAARIVLDAMKLRRRIHPLRHRLGVLVQGRQRPCRPHHQGLQGTRPAASSARSPASRRTTPRKLAPELKDKKLSLLLPHREAPPDVQPAHQHAAVQELPGQPAQLPRHGLGQPRRPRRAGGSRSSSARTPRACTAASSSTRFPRPSTRPLREPQDEAVEGQGP
jgi:hypothetical protein